MGKLAQTDRQIAAVRDKEPPRDYAVAKCVEAWDDLSTCRPVGMAVGAIPVTAIWALCDRRGYDREVSDVIEHVIRTLDVERSHTEAAKAAADHAQGKGRGKR